MYKKSFMLFTRPKTREVRLHHAIILLSLVVLTIISGCGRPHVNTDLEDKQHTAEQKIRLGVVEAAKSTIGIKYKLGGTTPKTGFDCSGLVLWSYLQYGIHIPRTTWEQMKAGEAVKKDHLEPGDILVFKITRRRKSRYHTGLYIGKGQFIHSPRTGKKIHIAKFSRYWDKRFVTARRIPVLK